jgi:hypothetical protein
MGNIRGISVPDLKPSVLRNQLAKLQKRNPGADAFALRCRRTWTGGATLTTDSTTFRVIQSSCELEIRDALVTMAGTMGPLVLLTDLNESDVGDDLLARFARSRIERLDDWQTLHDAFATTGVDSRLNRYPWLIEHLAQNIPEEGYPPSPNGTLTLDLAVGTFLHTQLLFPDSRPDARHVLLWSRNKSDVQGFLTLTSEQQSDVQQWILATAGQLGRFLLQIAATGEAADLVVCGLCCEPIFSGHADANPQKLREAAVRLERFTGHLPVTRTLGVEWAREAENALHDLESANDTANKGIVALQVERVLADLGVADHAWISAVAPSGFEQRLGRFGRRLASGLKTNGVLDVPELIRLADFAATHCLAALSPERIQRMHMARRLCGWLESWQANGSACLSTPLPSLANRYSDEIGMVDLAREALLPGDPCPDLSSAYRALLERISEAREAFNQAFGKALARHVAEDGSSPDCLNIEDILRRIVAPIARETQVLILVLDGMGMAVFHSLLDDIVKRLGWSELGPESGTWPLPVIAALPTITQVSRTALLGGRLPDDPPAREADALEANGDLRSATGGHAPRLFAKRDLLAVGGLELANTLTETLQNPRQRIVAAIINAVDDQLPHGDQLLISWRVHAIPTLEKLLHAARMTTRTVILVSDHGHVRDVETALTAGEDAQRFRPAITDLQEGEVLLRGRRVCRREGAIIAPWTEHLRYGRKQHGYHGGVTPQEVIVPLAVLQHGSHKIKGWEHRVRPTPLWWTGTTSKPAVVMVPSPVDSLPLFTQAAATSPAVDWIEALWQSPVMVEQLKLAPRGAPPKERVQPILQALAAHGGSMLLPALARHAEHPARVRGLIAVLKQMLNVDGYPVLMHDATSDTVTLDLTLLRTQFELEP